MMGIKRRIAIKATGIALSGAIFLGMGITAVAGDINENEERIIAFYEQVFSYDGELYVATESAKAAAYAKLASDGCDLTAAQADSYINQAWGNIANGIKQGYLVPYEEPEDTTEDTSDNTTDNTEDTPDDNTEDATTEDTTDDTTEDVSNTDNDTTENNTTADDSNNNNDNNSSDDSWLIDTATTEDSSKENVNMDEVVDGLKNNNGTAYNTDGEEISADDVADILARDDSLTVEQYADGTIYIIDADGNVVYKATLPVKNTGYNTGDKAVTVLIILVGCVVLGIIFKKIRRKKYFIPCIAVGITGVLAVTTATAGRGLVEELCDTWKSVWIQGAPQYSYAEGVQIMDDEPLFGALYGEISCDKIELRAPLYYGDDDKVLAKGVGTWAGSSLPGKEGTALIGGHDTTYFAPLEKLEAGDILNVTTSYGSFSYKVTDIKVSDVRETASYTLSEDKDELILYTCYPFGETGTERLDRYFVYAERVDGEAVE